MSSEWKEIGIFEFIQLAKFDLHLFDPQMLLSAIFFWNREARAFEFPCGFVCPTLLDIAAITGLLPLGERFHPNAFEEELSIKDISITWDKKTYLAFITAHMGQPGAPVSSLEHIAFLMYWLSACVFCTPSLQVPKYYYVLAQALHLKKKICLSKLLLASLYTCLDEASESLSRESGPRNLSGPLWLLQLWLNAILEKRLYLPSTPISLCELEGARLTTLTPRKRLVDNFEKYIRAFLSFTEFTEDLAPFLRQNLIGPVWLRQNNQVGSINPSSTDIWFGFLSWDVIFSGMRQKDVRLYPYQPQLFARQFGLCQMKPLPLRRKESIDADICVEEGNYEEVLDFILRPEKELKLTPSNFSPSFLVSKCYLRWWCYYVVDKLIDFDGFLKKLINSPLSCSQGPKQSAVIPQRVPQHAEQTPNWESEDDEDKESSKKGRKRKTAAEKVSLRSKSIETSKRQRVGSDSTKTVSTTKKQDKGKTKMVIPLSKKPQKPSGEKLLKDAMKSVPKDVEVIQLDSSRELSREMQKDMFPVIEATQQLSTPQVDATVLASVMASIEIPPQVEEGKVLQSGPLINAETRQDSAQGEPSFELQPPLIQNKGLTESPRPFTTSLSTQGSDTSSV
ncbi:uncharacterized protein LOC109818095 [Cajanus cajan]|uniref:uncharacterized protein LOC109818095 n=1 Tax=Cajanus cajan TaxID=3821 RepID=UPI00098DC1B7|nr:uncharacterized protein LOC109818095 [Cajanus cajan]